MAGENRYQEHPLIRTLIEDPSRFEFFQAVALVEGLYEDASPVGYQHAAGEKLRFAPALSLSIPTSDITDVEFDETDRLRMEVSFLGLYGPASPLPTFFTEEFLWAPPEEKGAQAFLDLFHHRFISLLYRVGWKYRLTRSYRPRLDNPFTHCVLSLCGLVTSGLVRASGLPLHHLLRYAGAFMQHPRSAIALEGVLADYFDAPAEVEQCSPRWTAIPRDQRCLLGVAQTRLGSDLSLGEMVLDVAGKVRLRFGPLHYPEYLDLLPSGSRYRDLERWMALFNEDSLDFDVELKLLAAEIPRFRVGLDDPMLGYNTWLGEPPPKDGAVVFQRILKEGKVTS